MQVHMFIPSGARVIFLSHDIVHGSPIYCNCSDVWLISSDGVWHIPPPIWVVFENTDWKVKSGRGVLKNERLLMKDFAEYTSYVIIFMVTQRRQQKNTDGYGETSTTGWSSFWSFKFPDLKTWKPEHLSWPASLSCRVVEWLGGDTHKCEVIASNVKLN